MKIETALYESMKADIKAVADACGPEVFRDINAKSASGLKGMHQLLTIVSRNRAYDDAHPGYARGWFRVLPHDGRDYCFFYANNCNDDHVHTALRAIKKELGL